MDGNFGIHYIRIEIDFSFVGKAVCVTVLLKGLNIDKRGFCKYITVNRLENLNRELYPCDCTPIGYFFIIYISAKTFTCPIILYHLPFSEGGTTKLGRKADFCSELEELYF